ncbi:MAG TPA: glycosyltransferase [Candidatus Acidoferrum sp.]
MLLAYILLAIAVAGTLSSWAFLLLSIGGAVKFHRDAKAQRLQAQSISNGSLPPVSLLKPVHGLESRLKENIESFFRLDYPSYEMIFAADVEDNPALAVVREICARHPQIPTHIMLTGTPPWPNPPAYAFFRMAEYAKYDILVTSDSDVFVDPSYLREVVPPVLDPKNGMLTCVYRGKNTGAFWSGVHAVGMSVEMTAGVVTANLLEGMKFGLGPTIVVRRDALEKIGGFSALSDYFANDFMLGNLIEKNGYNIVLSRHIIEHVIAPLSFQRVWQHEVRWARSTRGSRRWGHLFSGLIYAMPYGILGFAVAAALGHVWLGVALFVAALANRIIESWVIGWGITCDPAARSLWRYPLRDLLGFFVWCASYLGKYRAVWRNVQYDLTTDGRAVLRSGQPQSETPKSFVSRIH